MTTGWQIKPLGEMCDIVGGGTPSKDKTHASYYSGDILWATVRDMKGDLISNTEFKITPEAVKASATKVIPKGNVVIATRVGLGKVCRIEHDTAINQDLRGVVPKDANKLSVPFLFWWMKSVAPLIVKEGKGATVQGVTLPFVKSLRIPAPPFPEQQRIVTILDQAFEGIATATTNAEKNLANARELFESQLQSIFTNGSAVWQKNRLADIVTRLTNGYVGPTRDIYLKSGVPYLLARHVRNNRLTFDSKTFISEEFNKKNKKSILKAGDVLLVQSGHIGHSAVVSKEHEGHNCHAMIVITPIEGKVTGEFLSLYFNSPEMRQKFDEIRSGSTVPHLTCGEVRELKIGLPEYNIQQSVVAQAKELQAETQRLEAIYQQKLVAFDELKKSILHQAFSGQLH